MIRSWVKTGAAHIMSRTGLDTLVGSLLGARRGPLVIGYHRVVENFAHSAKTSIPSLLVSLTMLERHLDWIGRRFRFVSLDEAGARLDGTDSREDPIAAITFDDGYRDFYDHALPLLKRKGIPAAVFVVTDLVGTERVQVHDKLYLLLARRYQATREMIEGRSQAELEEVIRKLEAEAPIPEDTFRPFHSMTWEMLDEVRRAGMTIGSHTRTHVLMTKESNRRVTEEAVGSRKEIERRLGTNVRHFAYPSGVFDTAAVDAVAAAGYRFGYTTCTHRDAQLPQLTAPRTLLWENSCADSRGGFSGAILNCQIHRAFDLVSRCRQRHAASQESAYGWL